MRQVDNPLFSDEESENLARCADKKSASAFLPIRNDRTRSERGLSAADLEY